MMRYSMRLFRGLLPLLLAAGTVSAQKWEAHLQLGGLWNTRSNQPVTNQHSSPFSGLITVGIAKKWKGWETGISLGLYRYAYRIRGDFHFPFDTSKSYHSDFVEPNTAFVFTPFFNRVFSCGPALGWYLGAAPSYVKFIDQDLEDRETQVIKHTNGSGIGLMLHGGLTYRFSPGLVAAFEPSIGCVNMPGMNGRAWMFTVSGAFEFKFDIRDAKPHRQAHRSLERDPLK